MKGKKLDKNMKSSYIQLTMIILQAIYSAIAKERTEAVLSSRSDEWLAKILSVERNHRSIK
jgi:hypothetical protein